MVWAQAQQWLTQAQQWFGLRISSGLGSSPVMVCAQAQGRQDSLWPKAASDGTCVELEIWLGI